jgi:hypothetical protein
MVTGLQSVYIVIYHTDFIKALFDFKMSCGVTVHVTLTVTEPKFTELKLGDNFFVNNFKTDFIANLTNGLVAGDDRPQRDRQGWTCSKHKTHFLLRKEHKVSLL